MEISSHVLETGLESVLSIYVLKNHIFLIGSRVQLT